MLMPVARRLSGMKRDLDGQLERPTSAIGKGSRHREACRHQFGVVHACPACPGAVAIPRVRRFSRTRDGRPPLHAG